MVPHQPSDNGPSRDLQIQYLQSVFPITMTDFLKKFPKVSNIVDPPRAEILQGNSRQS